jgi:hypothetical protein
MSDELALARRIPDRTKALDAFFDKSGSIDRLASAGIYQTVRLRRFWGPQGTPLEASFALLI